MTPKQILYTLAALSLFSLAATSCSDNKGDEPSIPDAITNGAELDFLQNRLCILDEAGNIKERVYGRVLDESEPQTVSVGVDDFDEARDIFSSLFSSETHISDDGLLAQFSSGRGHAQLAMTDGTDGVIARADFAVDGLKFVSSMHFVLNSAWPENEAIKGFHTLGVQYQYSGWSENNPGGKDDELHPFVCIREYKNGIPALLVGASNKKYPFHKITTERSVRMNEVKEIREILMSNWTYFKAVFNDNGKSLLDENKTFWISNAGIHVWHPAVNLYTGKYDSFDYDCQVLFYKLGS